MQDLSAKCQSRGEVSAAPNEKLPLLRHLRAFSEGMCPEKAFFSITSTFFLGGFERVQPSADAAH